ncbi:hypothetical protein L2E82_44743 [Cichorium intybus]|uniref:Uncharacterized protein n=1 Tax=Cichorium intybus TaxID=13427 RepID=A0ACB8ZRL9_CICIN|nr:hypothetical protein L2E82_44743 [Cichorium intybus]
MEVRSSDYKVLLRYYEPQPTQRSARLQTLEKKISILERAVEVNSDNEELLLALMNAYQRRDKNDVLIDKWEKLLMHHSGSYKLWTEFLRIVQWDFSRFKLLFPSRIVACPFFMLALGDIVIPGILLALYLDIVKTEGLEISQPALDPNSTDIHHRITIRKRTNKFHRKINWVLLS